jgi:hypothetical protein
MVQIEVMKNEVITYQTPVDSIKPLWKERMTRGRTLLIYQIGGRQTVQSYQHSPTCCVQCSLTHTTLAHLSVSLPSSIQLSIRSRLTLTTYSYRCSLSLTIQHCSRRVSRSEGEREEWLRGFSRLLASAIIHCHVHVGPLVVSGICQTKNRVLL